MNAVDTNILFYACDPRDPRKQAAASNIITSLVDGVLLWQVACEYINISHKLEQFGHGRAHAMADVASLRQVWHTVLPTWNLLDRAEQFLTAYNLQFWDALIIAACLENGVKKLYSEDFDTSVRATGLEVINPFAP